MTKEQFKKHLKERFITLVISAFGLVAALSWNEAILSTFKYYFGEAGNLIAKYAYALFVTIVVVIITYSINRFLVKEEEEKK